MSVWRLVLAAVVLGVVVLLIAYARGDEHHRGDEIGATPDTSVVVRASELVGVPGG
jgi:hypothetical protein